MLFTGTKDYWEERWRLQQTRWDVGGPSTPLQTYIESLTDTEMSILIPGCGNAHEAECLLKAGFRDITLLDIAPAAVDAIRQKWSGKSGIKVICGDFFAHRTTYDLILEQTFFCALPPQRRPDYAAHMHRILHPGGLLAGVLFDTDFEQDGPPFGGNRDEFEALFTPYFEFLNFDSCYNSIPQRVGNEIFIRFKRRD